MDNRASKERNFCYKVYIFPSVTCYLTKTGTIKSQNVVSGLLSLGLDTKKSWLYII